jgi:hypothetical protein
MYLTAQRVVQLQTAREGVNAYHYAHRARGWDAAPPDTLPEADPGVLVAEKLEIAPAGNRVRSYLDVVAPDDAPWPEVRAAFLSFVSEAASTPLPWHGLAGRCLFRVGIEAGLSDQWAREVAELYQAVCAVRIGG